jgi:predicted Zn-dependent protease
MRLAAWLMVALLGLAPRAFAQALPDLGGADIAISPQLERRIGESIMREIRQDPSYVEDPEAEDYLQNLGMRLVQANPAARQDFQFFVLRDHTINAFALPGGFVAVHTGLLLAADTESQLASVLAHEIAHVSQRHVARMLSQQERMQMPMMVAFAAAILLGRARPDLAAGAAAAAQGSAVQTSLAYSRDFEREADRVGLQTLEAAGYDPNAMAAFFEKLQRATRLSDDSSFPGWLRDHPVTSERIADVQNKAAAMPYHQHADTPEFQLLRAKFRAQTGDARDNVASFESALRDHRYASEAAARYGLVTALLRAGKVADAGRELERLRALGIASPMIDTLAARVRQAAGDPAGAQRILATAQQRYPYWRSVGYAYIASLQDAGSNDAALAAIDGSLKLYPKDARLYTLQAKTYAALGKRLLQHHAQGEAYALQGSLPAAIEQLQLARASGDGDFYQLSMVDARLKELRAQYAAEMKDTKR